MNLTNEDVADILALLDSLPYDSLDLQTASFRLTLRRTPDGWTQASQVLSEPVVLEADGSPVGAEAPQAGLAAGGWSNAAIAGLVERAGRAGMSVELVALLGLMGRRLGWAKSGVWPTETPAVRRRAAVLNRPAGNWWQCGHRCRGRFTGRPGRGRSRLWRWGAGFPRRPWSASWRR